MDLALRLLVVALFGALGVSLRYGMVLFLRFESSSAFVATLLINIIGSFFIGAAYVLVVEKVVLIPIWREALLVGMLGGFTTFATFSLEVLQLLEGGRFFLAVCYLLASLIMSIGACWLSVTLTRFFISCWT